MSCGNQALSKPEIGHFQIAFPLLNLEIAHFSKLCKVHLTRGGGGGGNATSYVTGACHFARKIGTHNSVNSGGF